MRSLSTTAKRRLIPVLTATLLAAACSAPEPEAAPGEDVADVRARALGIHIRVMTIDTHVDIPQNFGSPEADPGVRGNSQVDLPKMREGRLDGAFFVVYVAQGPRTEQGYAAARQAAQEKFDGIFRMTRTHPDRIMLACRPSAVGTLQEGNRHAAMIGVENGYSIGRDLTLLRDYYDQCARYFGLVHNGHNDIADSATPNEGLGDAPEEHGGLSVFGEQVIEELNRLGIMVDVSHSSKKAMLHAIRVSRAPIIASHSGAAGVSQHRRNLDDEQLVALRDNGGVVQAVALADLVKASPTEKTDAVAALRTAFRLVPGASLDTLSADERARYDEQRTAIETRWPRASVSDFVDHIDYIVKVAGVDHVGIASDFDGGGGIDGWSDASETFNVTLELVRRGYTEEQIRKIWGGNLLRVWREVESIGEGARPSQ